MKFLELSSPELHSRLCGPGLFYRIGPFTVHLYSDLPDLAPLLQWLYADYHITDDESFADFHVNFYLQGGLRRWWRPQVQFRVDGDPPFAPFPQDTALPFLEWGLNWCVARRAHHYLMLHSAVLEKHGKAILLPAWPGSGKSTLCAALAHRGWRLLSDEFALVQPADLGIVPFPRLVPLKNESIGVIRAFAPDAVLGPEFPKTRKGTVSHLRPPTSSIDRYDEIVQAGWIVFPKFETGAALCLESMAKDRAFIKLSGNSFNYELIGLRGFETVGSLIEGCDCYFLNYGDLEQAVKQLDCLATEQT